MPNEPKSRKKLNTPFSKILASMLKERGLGVREAARLAGIDPSTITAWTAGGSPADYLAVKRLAKAMGVTLSFLLTGEDDSRPNGGIPSVAEVFGDGGALFDGYARITIQRLIPRDEGKKKLEEEKS